MPARKPLVIINGQTQQLSSSDSLDAQIGGQTITNNSGGTLTICSPFCFSGGTFQAARANSISTSDVIGIIQSASIAAAATGEYKADGILTATTTQWDLATGQTGGLTPGSIYYLSAATAGKLTTTPPTTTGELVVRIGIAISSTSLQIRIEPPILL